MDLLISSFKSYWEDKKAHPWHRIFNIIESHWEKERPEESPSETLLLIRDAVFGSLDAHSLSIALDISTQELLGCILKEDSWNDGKRAARNTCSSLLAQKIKKQQLDYLDPAGLKRDGLGYLVDDLQAALIDEFRKARPSIKKGNYNLKALHASVIGRLLLRDLQITDLTVGEAEAGELIEQYEHKLLELELERAATPALPDETAQMTLTGKIIDELDIGVERSSKKSLPTESQEPLTDYLAGKKQPSPKAKSQRKRARKRHNDAPKESGN